MIRDNVIKENNKEIFYTGKIDRVFKAVLCNEENQALLEEFLSRIMKRKVKILKYLRNEQPVNTILEKVKIVDVLVEIEDMIVHLELNNITGKINLKSIQIRNFTYVASDYASLIRRGKKYTDEVKVLAIDLTYGLSKKKDLIRQFSYQDKYGEKYIDNLETIVINMDKAMNFWYDKNTKEIENYKHLIMLDMNKEELKNLAKGDDLVMEYSKKVTDLNENPQFRKIMSAEEDYEKLQRTYLDNAKEIGYLSGVKEGHASGIKEGHTSGVKDGQQIERKNIINSMLKNGMPIKEISKCTDLSIEEINSLIN